MIKVRRDKDMDRERSNEKRETERSSTARKSKKGEKRPARKEGTEERVVENQPRVVIAQIGRARHCECKGHGFDPR